MGAIRGNRLDPEVKLELVGAVMEAKRQGFAISRSCELLMLSRRRLHRWIAGKDLDNLTAEDLADEPPVPKTHANKITAEERDAVLDAAKDPDNSHLRHRKLTHRLSREGACFVSPSTTLRLLQEANLVSDYLRPPRLKGQKPDKEATEPNQVWGWDISWLKVCGAFWYLIAIVDMYSRKIVGHAVRPQATSDDVTDVFDKALANDGLLAVDAPMPKSLSDRGPQMKSRSIRRFFADLGITQLFARPRTPADNAEIESFFATIKGERLYLADYDDPIKMINDVDSFVMFYNEQRLHQGVGFVTPAEKHDGRWVAITAAREEGMKHARQRRLQVNRGCGA
ncbi:MAG: IS3 family transposase [Actinomycetota bacterium]